MKTKSIYGRHPVLDALKAGDIQFEKILIQQGTRGDFEKTIRSLTRDRQIPLSFVPKEKLNRYSNNNTHQGVLAFVAEVEYQKLENVLPHLYEKGETPLFLLLDGITDVRNFGAIARSAACTGVHAIVIPMKGAAQINAEAMKTSAGTLSKIAVCREASISGAIDLLQQSGVQIYASSLEAESGLRQLDWKAPCAIVIGSEEKGVNSNFIGRADACFKIPQTNATDSFNVSVASGIILYEAMTGRME